MSISTTLFGEISHASLFFTGQLQNSWQMLVEPWGSAKPRLKITGVRCDKSCYSYVTFTLTVVVFEVRSFTRSNNDFSCSSPSCYETNKHHQLFTE